MPWRLIPTGAGFAVGGWFSKTGGVEFVTIFDVESGRVLRRLGPLPSVIGDLEVTRDGERLAAGIYSNGVCVWETQYLVGWLSRTTALATTSMAWPLPKTVVSPQRVSTAIYACTRRTGAC